MLKSLVRVYRWTVSFSIMTVSGIICFILVYGSFGLLRNFCVKYPIKYTARLIMILFGYTYKLPEAKDFPKKQVLYTINHNSYMDIYLLTGLGLPNVWYILSEKTLKFLPMIPMAKAAGTKYIPQQFRSRRRLNFFLKTTDFLKRTDNSIVGSAEGVRKHKHTIGKFNKGIFHMAMEAGIPIVPLFLCIPKEINPFQGQYSKTGELQLHILEEIDNSGWKLENIEEEIIKVRQVYVDHFNKVYNENID